MIGGRNARPSGEVGLCGWVCARGRSDCEGLGRFGWESVLACRVHDQIGDPREVYWSLPVECTERNKSRSRGGKPKPLVVVGCVPKGYNGERSVDVVWRPVNLACAVRAVIDCYGATAEAWVCG